MDYKGAIEFLEKKDYMWIERLPMGEIDKYDEKLDEAITLFKRGEKFEAMWREFKKLNYGYFNDWEIRCIKFKMNEFEQKYFPKPSDNFTKKVMDKINNEGEK